MSVRINSASVHINSALLKKPSVVQTVNPSLTDNPFKEFKMVYEFAKVTEDEPPPTRGGASWEEKDREHISKALSEISGLNPLIISDWEHSGSA